MRRRNFIALLGGRQPWLGRLQGGAQQAAMELLTPSATSARNYAVMHNAAFLTTTW